MDGADVRKPGTDGRARESDGRKPDAEGLIELIDRLEGLLNASVLSEIEIEAGETSLILRKPSALPAGAAAGAVDATAPPPSAVAPPTPSAASDDAQPVNAVLAPLTGLFYSAPSPGAQPYTSVGSHISVGQVIGLIEAMKLFNEIKSDRAGKVVRIAVQDGALVKAKQPLIEVE
jgi:acetyl-CoA carboxylase biotin carboxyl carrier protein